MTQVMQLKDYAKKLFKAWEKKFIKNALENIGGASFWNADTAMESGKEISEDMKTAMTQEMILEHVAIIQQYLIRYTNNLDDCEENRERVKQFMDCQKVKIEEGTIPQFNFVFTKGHLDFPTMIGIDNLNYIDFYIIWTLIGYKEIMVYNPKWDKWTEIRIKTVADNIINDMAYDDVKVEIATHVLETPKTEGKILVLDLKFDPTIMHDFVEAFGPAKPDSWC